MRKIYGRRRAIFRCGKLHRSQSPAYSIAECEPLEFRRLLTAAQVITPVPAEQTADIGETVSVRVDYSVDGTNQTLTTGLNLRMHYDARVLTLNSVSPRLSDSFSTQQTFVDEQDLDGDPETTHYLNVLWVDITTNWPGSSSASLFTAQFITSEFESTTVNFSGRTATGYELVAGSATIDRLEYSVQPTGTSTLVSEIGNRDAIDVWLNKRPSANVVMDILSSDEGEVIVENERLTFTPSNWNKTQTVFLKGVDDSILDGTVSSHVRFRIHDALSAAEFSTVRDVTRPVQTLDFEDDVTLAGTSGDDSFVFMPGTPHVVSLNGDRYEFRSVYPIVRFDGQAGDDSVTLYGDHSNDTGTLRPDSADLRSPSYNVASENSEVHRIYAGGGTNRVDAHGSEFNDVAVLKPQHMWIRANGSYGFAEGFQTVVAHQSEGYDQAQLYDSLGDDQLIHKPAWSSMVGEGFRLFANGFETARAWATGGMDSAEFYDSAGDDRFVGKPEFAYLWAGDLYRYAKGFDTTTAWSTAGGNDDAQLYDSAGNDLFVARTFHSYLVTGAVQNHVRNFKTVRAYSTVGGFDEAQFYDSEIDDYFVATRGQSSMQEWDYTESSLYYNQQSGFDKVGAYKTKSGTDRIDQFSGLDYMFVRSGDWDVFGFR